MPILIEVAISTLDDARIAPSAGADRLELSSALELGGLTPSLGTFQSIGQEVLLPVIAMLRPRAGGFVYTQGDFLMIQRDAELFLENGAAGLAFGFLTVERELDVARISQLVKIANGRETVFHRAFELVADPFTALDRLIDLGITRILTSGQQTAAPAGADLIRRLIERAAGRIQILPGGGITPANAAPLLAQTGADQLHGTFSELCHDPAIPVASSEFRRASARLIQEIRATVNH